MFVWLKHKILKWRLSQLSQDFITLYTTLHLNRRYRGMAAGPATANRFFARRGRNGAADRTLTLHTTSHTFTKRSVIERTNQNLWFSTFSSSYHTGSFCGIANEICLVIQRSGNFIRATNIFGYPRGAPARFVLPSWISGYQVAPQLDIYFSAIVYTCTMEAKRATLENTSCKRTSSGKAIWSPTLQASTIWPEIKGEQSSNS